MTLTRRAWQDVAGNMHGVSVMASKAEMMVPPRGGRWRFAVWGVAVALLSLPAIAMQFTGDVDWDSFDFIVFGSMLALALAAYEGVTRLPGSRWYRLGFGLSIVGCFLLVWINLAVGIIGPENNAANLMYLGVLAVVAAGGFASRFTPNGMSRTMISAAVFQVVIGGVALVGDMGSDGINWPRDTLGVTGIFVLLWLAAAGLLRMSERT